MPSNNDSDFFNFNIEQQSNTAQQKDKVVDDFADF
jgi:hypothetical protein